MSKPMMKCGHSAHGRAKNPKTGKMDVPCCIICHGDPKAMQIDTSLPDFSNRLARCTYYGGKCNAEVQSSPDLAFFKHHADKDCDEYYCGCWGWD